METIQIEVDRFEIMALVKSIDIMIEEANKRYEILGRSLSIKELEKMKKKLLAAYEMSREKID